MLEDTQCSEEGPFFPATTRNMILNGFALEEDILQSPDWLVLLLILAAVFLVMIIIVIALVSWLILILILYVFFQWETRTLSGDSYLTIIFKPLPVSI